MSIEPRLRDRNPDALRQRFVILLEADVADQVRAAAAEGRRPLNSQFSLIVEEWLAARKMSTAA